MGMSFKDLVLLPWASACLSLSAQQSLFLAYGIAAKALPNTLRDVIIIPVPAALSFGRVDEKLTQETLSNRADV